MENKSELYINNNNNNTLIVTFGGLALKIGSIPPFEFLRFLSSHYPMHDLLFYTDIHQCWYHKGIDGLTNNIGETVIYLNDKIKNYKKVIFLGVSAGGYASILFGSLCKNVSYVVSFIPQTILKNPVNIRFKNLKTIIKRKKKYILFGNKSVKDINDLHHIYHCNNLRKFKNVNIIRKESLILKELRDNGVLINIINRVLARC